MTGTAAAGDALGAAARAVRGFPRRRWCVAAAFSFAIVGASSPATAHEVRPAYLELRETAPSEFTVLWKTPMRGESRLALRPEFSGKTEPLTTMESRETGSAAVQTWRLRSLDALRGSTVRIAGLDATMTDALARVEFADGTTWVHRFTPSAPAATVPETQSVIEAATEYLRLGVEHILYGADHLAFVLGLMLLLEVGAPARRRLPALVRTITAFTVAHSVTLGLATLGFVHVPTAPVDAAVALSIVFVASEVLAAPQGRGAGEACDDSVALRAPWVVAFAFGLLHGFGFASALSALGLPQGHIPLALLSFNLGVEAGQLLFVAVVISATSIVSGGRTSRWPRQVAAYALGSVAMFWVIQRVSVL